MSLSRATILVGENGSGKTRELEHLHSGRLSELRYVASARHPRAKRFGFSRQAVERLTLSTRVSDHLMAPLVASGTSPANALWRVANLLSLFDFAHLLTRSFRHLSGGEDQVLGILSAVIRAQHGLIIDDPIGMLDASRATAVEALLLSLVEEARMSDSDCFEMLVGTTEPVATSIDVIRKRAADSAYIAIRPTRRSESIEGAFDSFVGQLASETNGRSSIDLNGFAVSNASGRPFFLPISQQLDGGTLYLLTGPNGIGKSLLLKAISGRLPRSLATIGACVHSQALALCQVVPQDSHWLLSDRIPATFLRSCLPRTPAASAAVDTLIGSGVIWTDRVTREASVGEVRFATFVIGILSALVRAEVKWLLVDEPDAFLDQARAKAVSRLLSLVAATGKGVIVSTHRRSLYSTGRPLSLTPVSA